MDNVELSLILPVHNQELIIKKVVKDIIREIKSIDYEIILVENGSKDKTLDELKRISHTYKNIRVNTASQGYGSAIIKGLKEAKGKYVSYMPSDGQLDPKLLPKLFKLIKTNYYDLVKIKRTTRENSLRFYRSKIFNLLSRLLFRIPVQDINGSPRIFLRKWLKLLNLKYKDSFIDTEMAVKVYYLKWKIKEIPAKTLPRLGGKSTVSFLTILEFLRNLINYKIIFRSDRF